METAILFNGEGGLDLSGEQLSAMSNADLLQIVRLLECRDADSASADRDHRRYLKRHELERLVHLAARLRRRPRMDAAECVGAAPVRDKRASTGYSAHDLAEAVAHVSS